MPNELKPCPFCGGEAFVWRTNHRTYVQCENYVMTTHRIEVSGITDKEAFELWNRRADNA